MRQMTALHAQAVGQRWHCVSFIGRPQAWLTVKDTDNPAQHTTQAAACLCAWTVQRSIWPASRSAGF